MHMCLPDVCPPDVPPATHPSTLHCPPPPPLQLVDCAWAKWLQEEDGVVDDITVVAVKLNPV